MDDPEPPIYTAEQLPVLRRNLIQWHRHQGPQFMELMVAGGHQALVPGAVTAAEAAEALIGEEIARLERAELFYAGGGVVDLVLGAAPSMPLFAPKPWDFPAPAGMILFGKPLAHREIFDREIKLAEQLGFDPVVATGGYPDVEVVAAAWGPWSPQTGHPAWMRKQKYEGVRHWDAAGGVWITFYAHPRNRASADTLKLSEQRRVRLFAATPPLNQETEVAFAFAPDEGEPFPAGFTAEDYILNPDEQTPATAWVRVLLAVFGLLKQENLTETADEVVPRAERKRHERDGLPAPKAVHLIRLRGRRDHGGAAGGESGGHLTKRFPVGPFWRQQWYPSAKVHRPKLIPQYWKGPEDAPVTGAERVRVFPTPQPPPPQM